MTAMTSQVVGAGHSRRKKARTGATRTPITAMAPMRTIRPRRQPHRGRAVSVSSASPQATSTSVAPVVTCPGAAPTAASQVRAARVHVPATRPAGTDRTSTRLRKPER